MQLLKWKLWPWNWRKVRKAQLSTEDRDLFERYGEDVIGNVLTGVTPAAWELRTILPHSPPGQPDIQSDKFEEARNWLTECRDRQHRHEALTLAIEVGVVLLIGLEIYLSISHAAVASREARDQAKVLHNMEISTAATAKAAETSAATAAETLRVSQRAYIAIATTVLQQPAPGQQPRFQLAYTNVGHTTALHVSIHSQLIEVVFTPGSLGQMNPMTIPVPTSQKQANEMARSDRSRTHSPTFTLEAGQTSEDAFPWRAYTQEAIDNLKAGKIRLFLFVYVTYDDIFGHSHEVESCSWLYTTLTGFAACEEDFNQSR